MLTKLEEFFHNYVSCFPVVSHIELNEFLLEKQFLTSTYELMKYMEKMTFEANSKWNLHEHLLMNSKNHTT